MTLRAVALVLVLAVDGVLGARALAAGAGARAIVLADAGRPRQPTSAWADPLASLTSDDVARGAWALERGGALAPGQLEAMRPLLARGAAQHAAIGRQRMQVRALRLQWLADQADLAGAIRDRWPTAVHR